MRTKDGLTAGAPPLASSTAWTAGGLRTRRPDPQFVPRRVCSLATSSARTRLSDGTACAHGHGHRPYVAVLSGGHVSEGDEDGVAALGRAFFGSTAVSVGEYRSC